MKRLLPIFLILTLILSGCRGSAAVQREFFAMDTLISIKLWGEEALISETVQELERLEALFSSTDPESDLYALNTNGNGTPDEDTLELLEAAIFYSQETGGAFDPTVYPLMQAWGFPQKDYRVPSPESLDALCSLVGTEQIVIQGDTVSLSSGCAVDLGGIAKGYCAQHCCDLLKEQGVGAAILSLGGNVQTLGAKPDGNPWVVGIADPKEPTRPVAELHFFGSMALVTSGSYQRYFETDGQRYHHILHPDTGLPVENGLASVTVLSENGTMADAYSTALFVMGFEEGTAFWRSQKNFEVIFILDDGSIHASPGAGTLLQGCDFTEICP